MSNFTLQEIQRDYLALEDLLNEAEGEITPILNDWMVELERSLEAKSVGYVYAHQRLEATAELNRNYAKQYMDRARILESAAEQLKSRIKDAMLNMGLKEIKGKGASLKLSNTQPRLEINEALIPPEFIHTEMIEKTTIDKDGIKSQLKDGISIPGARLLESYALRMKMEIK